MNEDFSTVGKPEVKKEILTTTETVQTQPFKEEVQERKYMATSLDELQLKAEELRKALRILNQQRVQNNSVVSELSEVEGELLLRNKLK